MGAVLALVLIAEVVAAAVLIGRPSAPAHMMKLIDRGGPAALPGRIAEEMPGAVEAVSTFWGDDWPREIVVVTTGTDADFAAQTGSPNSDWTGVAAVAAANRIVFAPGANAMSEPALRIVLRHELFHYATRSAAAPDAPRWLLEGVADYVARPAGPRPGPTALPARLPTDAELDAGGKQGSAAYDRAWWFARFVADEYGPSGLKRLYVDGCPRAALGVGLAELISRWQNWLAG